MKTTNTEIDTRRDHCCHGRSLMNTESRSTTILVNCATQPSSDTNANRRASASPNGPVQRPGPWQHVRRPPLRWDSTPRFRGTDAIRSNLRCDENREAASEQGPQVTMLD